MDLHGLPLMVMRMKRVFVLRSVKGEAERNDRGLDFTVLYCDVSYDAARVTFDASDIMATK